MPQTTSCNFSISNYICCKIIDGLCKNLAQVIRKYNNHLSVKGLNGSVGQFKESASRYEAVKAPLCSVGVGDLRILQILKVFSMLKVFIKPLLKPECSSNTPKNIISKSLSFNYSEPFISSSKSMISTLYSLRIFCQSCDRAILLFVSL